MDMAARLLPPARSTCVGVVLKGAMRAARVGVKALGLPSRRAWCCGCGARQWDSAGKAAEAICAPGRRGCVRDGGAGSPPGVAGGAAMVHRGKLLAVGCRGTRRLH